MYICGAYFVKIVGVFISRPTKSMKNVKFTYSNVLHIACPAAQTHMFALSYIVHRTKKTTLWPIIRFFVWRIWENPPAKAFKWLKHIAFRKSNWMYFRLVKRLCVFGLWHHKRSGQGFPGNKKNLTKVRWSFNGREPRKERPNWVVFTFGWNGTFANVFIRDIS